MALECVCHTTYVSLTVAWCTVPPKHLLPCQEIIVSLMSNNCNRHDRVAYSACTYNEKGIFYCPTMNAPSRALSSIAFTTFSLPACSQCWHLILRSGGKVAPRIRQMNSGPAELREKQGSSRGEKPNFLISSLSSLFFSEAVHLLGGAIWPLTKFNFLP